MADPALTAIETPLVDLVARIVRDRAADWSAIEDHPYPESWWATEMLARTRQPGPLRCVGLDVPATTHTPVGKRAAWLPDFLFEAGDPSRTLVWTELKGSGTPFGSLDSCGRRLAVGRRA